MGAWKTPVTNPSVIDLTWNSPGVIGHRGMTKKSVSGRENSQGKAPEIGMNLDQSGGGESIGETLDTVNIERKVGKLGFIPSAPRSYWMVLSWGWSEVFKASL